MAAAQVKYLLDTNVVREVGKATRHQNVAAWLKLVDDADLAVSALSVKEMTTGAARLRKTKPEVAKALEAMLQAVLTIFEGQILPIDLPVAVAWGESLAKSGKHVDDAGIAATALVHGLTVVTRNVSDFTGRGVELFDPFKAPRPVSAQPREG